jgi:hypothetical protein
VLAIFEGRSQRPPIVDDALNQSHRQRLICLDGTPGKDEVQGPALTDESWQTNRSTIYQRHADAAVEHPKHRTPGGHTQIAPHGKFESASHCVALDGGDHRFSRCPSRRTHGARRVLADIGKVTLGHRLEVEACAKGTRRPGQNRCVQLRVIFKGLERFAKGSGGPAVDCVTEFRAIDGNDRDRAVGFVKDRWIMSVRGHRPANYRVL